MKTNLPGTFKHFVAALVFFFANFSFSLSLFAVEAESAPPSRLILDMVYEKPGEPPQPTSFRNPCKLADWGYNG